MMSAESIIIRVKGNNAKNYNAQKPLNHNIVGFIDQFNSSDCHDRGGIYVYQIVTQTIAESIWDRVSVHSKNAVFRKIVVLEVKFVQSDLRQVKPTSGTSARFTRSCKTFNAFQYVSFCSGRFVNVV